MDLGISGKRAIVSAGTAGLGFAAAHALVQEGVRVAVCGREIGKTREAASRHGHDTVAFACDLSVRDAPERFVRDAIEDLGGCDILVANAGGPPPGTFASTELDAYRDALELDCLSAIAMCRAAVPAMQARGWGRVVAVTSVGVKQPIANLIASSVARAALTSFLKITAREVARDGVTVNNVCPGFHATGRLTSLHDDAGLESLTTTIPARRLGNPADFGRVIAFLCSEAANYVTGTSIQIDGGAYMGLI